MANATTARLSIHLFPPPSLEPSQTLAVERILSDSDADRISVVQGPPGTGKTYRHRCERHEHDVNADGSHHVAYCSV